jgi:hypothetical protein
VASLPAVVSIVETEWHLFGKVPTAHEVGKRLGIHQSHVEKILDSPEAKARLKKRGITNDTFLTPEQVAAANVMLDYSDSRSQAAKLRSLGVSSQTWQGWLSSPQFSRYLKTRAENLLDDVGIAEGHTALLKQVGRGNIQAVKLLYEVTGRHRDSASLNVEFFLQRVIEIIQRNVDDPATLAKVAEEFKTLMGEVT